MTETHSSDLIETEWQLEYSSIPDTLLWARFQLFADGTATTFHPEFGLKQFANEEDAQMFLTDEEYKPWEHLVEDGRVEPGLRPPEGASDAELWEKMLVERSVVKVIWYVSEVELPDNLLWSRKQIYSNGAVGITVPDDPDETDIRMFDGDSDAVIWLSERRFRLAEPANQESYEYGLNPPTDRLDREGPKSLRVTIHRSKRFFCRLVQRTKDVLGSP